MDCMNAALRALRSSSSLLNQGRNPSARLASSGGRANSNGRRPGARTRRRDVGLASTTVTSSPSLRSDRSAAASSRRASEFRRASAWAARSRDIRRSLGVGARTAPHASQAVFVVAFSRVHDGQNQVANGTDASSSSSEESSLSLSPKTRCAVRGGGGCQDGAAAVAAARPRPNPRSWNEMDDIAAHIGSQQQAALLAEARGRTLCGLVGSLEQCARSSGARTNRTNLKRLA